jgi:hypothetical protein
MMWAAGVLASVSSITYPAISAFVSMHSDADKQGLVQGMVTGMRGLCNGLGPAMFGVIFYLFHIDLNDDTPNLPLKPFVDENNRTNTHLDIMPQVHTLYLQVSIVSFCLAHLFCKFYTALNLFIEKRIYTCMYIYIYKCISKVLI